MARKNESIDIAVPAAIIELGLALPGMRGVRTRKAGEPPDSDQMTAIEDRVLAMVRASSTARTLVGIRESGLDDAERRLRLRAFAYLSCKALRETSHGNADMTEVAVAAMDPTAPPGEALLVARHGIGRMVAEGVLQACLDGQFLWNPRVFISPQSLLWVSGGRSSLGIITPQRLANARIRDGDRKTDGETGDLVPPPLSAKTIRERIAARVVGLEEGGQLDVVSGRLAMHMVRAELLAAGSDPGTPNEVILILGESGAGKSFLCDTAGLVTGLPAASANAAEMTASGYVGLSAEDGLRNLMAAAKGRAEVARFGLMTYDEITKRARSLNDSPVNSTAVQNELLRLVQGQITQVGGKRSNYEPTFWINTYGTFFFLCGHAPGLERLIDRRLGGKAIGFGSGQSRHGTRGVLLDCLEEYGLVPEILNRLTAIVTVPRPTIRSLCTAATAPNGVIRAYGRLLGDASLSFDEKAVLAMAEHCLGTQTYYRGLSAIVSAVTADAVAQERKGEVMIMVADVHRAVARMDDGVADLLHGVGRREPPPGSASSDGVLVGDPGVGLAAV